VIDITNIEFTMSYLMEVRFSDFVLYRYNSFEAM